MHRSGTSFLARSLNLGGVDLGGLESLTSHEFSPLEDNPKGHWENKDILNLTEETLHENNGSWDNIPSKITISEELKKKINDVFQKFDNPFLITGIKDPRLLICYEAWKELIPKNIIFVGIFRNPLTVAESLKQRNNFSYEKSIELWKIYNEKMLKLIKQNNGFLLNFDWSKEKILSEIQEILKKLNLDGKADLEKWYSSELLRSDKTVNENFQLGKEITTLYEDLKEQANQNSTISVESFLSPENLIHGLLNQNQNQFAYLLDYFSELTSKLSELETQIQNKNQKMASLQNEFDERSSWALKLDKENQQLTKKSYMLENQISNLEQQLSTEKKQLENIQTKLYDANYQLEQIKRSMIFGFFQKITKGIDSIFPPSSSRGEKMRLLRNAYLTYRNQGSDVLVAAAKQKYRLGEKFEASPSKSTLKFRQTKSLENGLLLSEKISDKPDEKLRNFLNYNFGSVLNLSKFPKVSIIILTYDQVELLKKNLESIKIKSTYQNYEIIVVTNNNDRNSEMRTFLQKNKIQTYVYDKEYSFAGMNNFGVSKTTGDYVVFLNDDVEIISPNWLEAMLSLILDDSVGAVGGKLLFPNNKLQEAGCIVWKGGNAWNYGRNENPNDPKYNFVRQVDYCSGACLMVKKDIFNKLGGFDTQFHPAYCEDVDLCFSIRNLGLSVLYQPLTCLIHYEGTSQGTNTNKGIKSFQVKNQEKFFKKWQEKLKNHLTDSKQNSIRERQRNNGYNILFIDHYVPEPDHDSGSLRTFRMLGILSSIGHNITFWPDNLNPSQPYTTELQQKGIEVIFGPTNFKDFLKDRKNSFDLVFLSRPYVSIKYIDLIKEILDDIPIVYDTTDLHFLRMQRQSKLDKVSENDISKMKDMELSLMKKSDLTLLTSKEEAKLLHKEDNSLKFLLLSNIHTFNNNTPLFSERKDLMFLGGFRHPPNVDSVKYFVDKIFSKVIQKIPDIKLYIVGSDPPESVKDLESNNIEVTGYVRDVDEFFMKCKILVAPLRFGAGVKGKITQSLTRGLPVITTNIGAEGIDLKDGENCMIAENPDDFANKVIQVYQNELLWTNLRKNGIVISKYYWPETIRDLFSSLFNLLEDTQTEKH